MNQSQSVCVLNRPLLTGGVRYVVVFRDTLLSLVAFVCFVAVARMLNEKLLIKTLGIL
jgi:hypothetical protein